MAAWRLCSLMMAPMLTPDPPLLTGLNWTASRRALEVLLTNEQAAAGSGVSGPMTEQQRLEARLQNLHLDMLVMAGDGNCQFRSVSFELFGSQDYHPQVRKQAIDHIRCGGGQTLNM